MKKTLLAVASSAMLLSACTAQDDVKKYELVLSEEESKISMELNSIINSEKGAIFSKYTEENILPESIYPLAISAINEGVLDFTKPLEVYSKKLETFKDSPDYQIYSDLYNKTKKLVEFVAENSDEKGYLLEDDDVQSKYNELHFAVYEILETKIDSAELALEQIIRSTNAPVSEAELQEYFDFIDENSPQEITSSLNNYFTGVTIKDESMVETSKQTVLELLEDLKSEDDSISKAYVAQIESFISKETDDYVSSFLKSNEETVSVEFSLLPNKMLHLPLAKFETNGDEIRDYEIYTLREFLDYLNE